MPWRTSVPQRPEPEEHPAARTRALLRHHSAQVALQGQSVHGDHGRARGEGRERTSVVPGSPVRAPQPDWAARRLEAHRRREVGGARDTECRPPAAGGSLEPQARTRGPQSPTGVPVGQGGPGPVRLHDTETSGWTDAQLRVVSGQTHPDESVCHRRARRPRVVEGENVLVGHSGQGGPLGTPLGHAPPMPKTVSGEAEHPVGGPGVHLVGVRNRDQKDCGSHAQHQRQQSLQDRTTAW